MCLSVQLLLYFSVPSRHVFMSSTLSWSKTQKSEIVESIREIAYKEEKQLFTIIVTGVFPRNSNFVYSSAHLCFSFCGGQIDGSELEWRAMPSGQKQTQKSWQCCCWLPAGVEHMEANGRCSSGHGELGLDCWKWAIEGVQQLLSKQNRAWGFCGCPAEVPACHDHVHGVRKTNVSKASAILGDHRFRFTFPEVHQAVSACYCHPVPLLCEAHLSPS